ncbi:MAG: hypothetical protein RLZZ156_793 [Deinococcota bacterium]|jgi:hypothetical protein
MLPRVSGTGQNNEISTEIVQQIAPQRVDLNHTIAVGSLLNAQPDLQEVERFLDVLSPSHETITFQTFDDSDQKRPELISVRTGTIESQQIRLAQLNFDGAGIFFTVNQQDKPNTRNAANTTRIRALFADLDGIPLDSLEKIALLPTIVINSSPDRFHAYWCVDDVPVTQFKLLQKRIAAILNSDSSVCDLPRVMRLPGFWHNKSTPFQTRILEIYRDRRYTCDEFENALTESETIIRGYAIDVGHHLNRAISTIKNAKMSTRNITLNRQAFSMGQICVNRTLDTQKTIELLEAAGVESGLSRDEARVTVRNGFEAGQRTPRHIHRTDIEEKRELLERFTVVDGCICESRKFPDGNIERVALCNFVATIKTELLCDDGINQYRVFRIGGKLRDERDLPECEIPAEQFGAMQWVVPSWGAVAIVATGAGTRDKLRQAVQVLSAGKTTFQTQYTHTGWRKINGNWVYLSASGGIGADGIVPEIAVKLTGALERYALPTPPSSQQDTRRTVRASLVCLDVAPREITLLLWLAAYRAVIDTPRFSMYLYGLTGAVKSGLAAMVLQHFAPTAHYDALTAQWESTGNALERLLFEAQHTVAVIDDFQPQGSRQHVNELNTRSNRVLRAQGNGGGKSRMGADLHLRPVMPPRGMTISTGEDVPSGKSLRARLLILEIPKNAVLLERLRAVSNIGRDGVLAGAMAAFVQWLARDLDGYRQQFRVDADNAESIFVASHRRNITAAAEVLATFQLWSKFALEMGCLEPVELDNLDRQLRATLQKIIAAQVEQHAVTDPATRFPSLIRGMLLSGRIHFRNADSGLETPTAPENWGWRSQTIGLGEQTRIKWEPRGRCVGWIRQQTTQDDPVIYFEPNAIYSELTRFSNSAGDAIVRTAPTLWREVAAKRLIYTDVKSYAVKRTIRGSKQRVLHVTPDCVLQILTGDSIENVGTDGTDGTDGIISSNTQLSESITDYWLEQFSS